MAYRYVPLLNHVIFYSHLKPNFRGYQSTKKEELFLALCLTKVARWPKTCWHCSSGFQFWPGSLSAVDSTNGMFGARFTKHLAFFEAAVRSVFIKWSLKDWMEHGEKSWLFLEKAPPTADIMKCSSAAQPIDSVSCLAFRLWANSWATAWKNLRFLSYTQSGFHFCGIWISPNLLSYLVQLQDPQKTLWFTGFCFWTQRAWKVVFKSIKMFWVRLADQKSDFHIDWISKGSFTRFKEFRPWPRWCMNFRLTSLVHWSKEYINLNRYFLFLKINFWLKSFKWFIKSY